VILVEAGPRLLPQMPERLSASARRQLERFCVEVRLNTKVADIRRGAVQLDGGNILAAENLIWAAGVAAHPLAALLSDLQARGANHHRSCRGGKGRS
jgi:NADH dehydrogenase